MLWYTEFSPGGRAVPPTLKRILWNGLPAAAALAVVGFLLAETADLFLDANRPVRGEVERVGGIEPLADPTPEALRRTLPVTLAVWGFALVAAGEGIRRLVKGPPKKPGKLPPVPPRAEVDKLLSDLMKKVEADRVGPEVATPPPAGAVSTARSDRP